VLPELHLEMEEMEEMEETRAQKEGREQLTPEQLGEVLVNFVRDNGRTPSQGETVDGLNIGVWYVITQKQKVKSKGDEAYEWLMGLGRAAGLNPEAEEKYADEVRQSLDALLEGRGQQLTQEQWGEVLVVFVLANNCTPSQGETVDGQNIGAWYKRQQEKVKSKGDEAYERLMGFGRAAGLGAEAEKKYADLMGPKLDALLDGRAQKKGRDKSNNGTT
jgi:hypothetical protein